MTIWQGRPKWLGGTSRVPYSRRMYRARRREFLRANWKLLGAVLVFFTGLGSLLAWTLDGYLLGATQATVVFTYVGMTVSVFHATNPRMIGQLAGAWGEENTRDLLERARRKKLIWGWIDGVATAAGDIDHLVVTRRGGLVAIDSKWRNDVTTQRLVADAEAAAKAARTPNSILRSLRVPVGMTPVVVVWGGARAGVPSNACVGGVDFVGGRRLLDWIRRLPDEEVDKPSARELLRLLHAFRDRVQPM
jgi:hypothetical protein